jgi:adenine phosphoribosyltransferase
MRDVRDFPIPGVVFKDFGPVWADPGLNRRLINEISQEIKVMEVGPDVVAGVESRGFIYGMAIADSLGVPFIPIRKAGKLPGKTNRLAYQLEYGEDALECQAGLIPEKAAVLIHDDVLATGGTACATGELIEAAGGEIWGFSFLLNLEKLKGLARLNARFAERYFHALLSID